MKRLTTSLLLFWCVLGFAENKFVFFHEANLAFDQGNYESAIEKYKTLISQGEESGDLYFNVANAYFKTGKLGQSIYYYRLASELTPRDPDIRFNLAYVREKVSDRVENRDSFLQHLAAYSDNLTEKEAYYLMTASMALLFLLSLLSLYRGAEWMKLLRNGFLALVVFFSLIAFHHTFLRAPVGVVIAPEAKVYSGVGKDNVVLFSLHEGVEFTVADALDAGWIRIQLPDGKQGWTKTEWCQSPNPPKT